MSPRTMSPGLKSTNLYGPVPTGLRLPGASRDLAPIYGPKTCFGMIMPSAATKAVAQKGVGFGKATRTVCESTFVTETSLYMPLVHAAVAGSRANSQVNTTSSAVNGWPSCQVTPFLSFQVTLLPSAASPPLSRVGTSAARIGTRLASPSQTASGS